VDLRPAWSGRRLTVARRKKTWAEPNQEWEDACSRAWDSFRRELAALRTVVDTEVLLRNSPRVDSPGRRYCSNLGFFLGDFISPTPLSPSQRSRLGSPRGAIPTPQESTRDRALSHGLSARRGQEVLDASFRLALDWAWAKGNLSGIVPGLRSRCFWWHPRCASVDGFRVGCAIA
jgi:hypothetical protein